MNSDKTVATKAHWTRPPIDGGEFRTMVDNAAVRESQDRLLRQALRVLRTRYELGIGYPGVSSAEAADVVVALEAAASADDGDEVDREEAIALAHRLVDDDQPEVSPLWPCAPH